MGANGIGWHTVLSAGTTGRVGWLPVGGHGIEGHRIDGGILAGASGIVLPGCCDGMDPDEVKVNVSV